MKDNEKRLPIDVLAEAGVYDVQLFEAFVMAETRAVNTRDLKNKHVPFVTAGLAGQRYTASSVYHLFRAKPHVTQSFLNAKRSSIKEPKKAFTDKTALSMDVKNYAEQKRHLQLPSTVFA